MRTAKPDVEGIVAAALTEYLAMRATGVSAADAERGLELVLREALPPIAPKLWPADYRIACQRCDDAGHLIVDVYRRGVRYDAMDPCSCPKGDRWRPKTPAASDDDAAVSKASKRRRSFTRFGR